MRSGWTDKAIVLLNRGFPRMYLLSMLKNKPMNAKELIETLLINSGGKWKPSPKIVYPLLAKLLEEDLLYQTEEGQYALTRKGTRVVSDAGTVSRTLKKQVNYLGKLSTVAGNTFVTGFKKRFS
ncbi:MAG TPA: PadR family transcriptional regulator [Nitrososphaeraceae archaeon]|nr:PadR family transcriptional regulator [Nitrososphaeraceae archaeon]